MRTLPFFGMRMTQDIRAFSPNATQLAVVIDHIVTTVQQLDILFLLGSTLKNLAALPSKKMKKNTVLSENEDTS